MGNKTPQSAPKPCCQECKQKINCSNCQQCAKCSPIINCYDCLLNTPENIKVQLSFQDLKMLYETGIIKSVKAGISRASSSLQIPLIKMIFGKHFDHLFIEVQVQSQNDTGGLQMKKVIIEGSKAGSGNMKIKITQGAMQVLQFKKIKVQNVDFKALYHQLWNNQHGKKYDLFSNNCFHIGINVISFLVPKIQSKYLSQIHQYKDKQFSAFSSKILKFASR